MTLLVFGQTGQVARELARRAPDAVYLGRGEADLTDPMACASAVHSAKAKAVIIAAAYTAVDRAETEKELAMTVNGRAPTAIAKACAERDCPIVYISTDYVFDGRGSTAWRPSDPTAPLGAYGESKLAGEVGLRGVAKRHAVLRTSWVFSAHGSNFVKTMLGLAERKASVDVVGDQIGGPTPAAGLADAALRLSERLQSKLGPSGTYHFAGKPEVSWAEFARAIFDEAGLNVSVKTISTQDFPTLAHRPANSRLDCHSLMRDHGIDRPDWRSGLREVLAELL